MSHAATNWAIQQRGLKPTTKIVLWHLSDRFNPDYGCFPSQELLASDCEISRATLNRHLDDLETRGLIRRIRIIDSRTGQQRPTRYLLGFEPGFTPSRPGPGKPGLAASSGADGAEIPCPDLSHGPDAESACADNGLTPETTPSPCLISGHGTASQIETRPCLKNPVSRVSNCDTNLVREPLKEEEGAQAHENFPDHFFEDLLEALGFAPGAPLPGWWQGWPPRTHIRRWRDDLGLDEDAILAVARASRQDHPEPPDGPKALDRAMQRAAQRLRQTGVVVAVKGPSNGNSSGGNHDRRRKRDAGPRPSADELAVYYAALVNSEKFLPASTISNTMRDAMLARGLVTTERLRERGVR